MRNDQRDIVVTEVQSRMLAACIRQTNHVDGLPLDVLINDTLYHEQKRMETDRRSPRRTSDQVFWGEIKVRLRKAGEVELRTLLARIIRRFSTEILGNFNSAVYQLSTNILPSALPLILNAMSPRKLLNHRSIPRMDSTIHVQGDMETLRRCQEAGTVIFAPTHVSNLDSVVIGWALLQLGLPPFTYGAGLNLFTNPVMSFFLRNLGAYRVDRLKTAPLYKDVLKEYATVSLEYGQPNLFFPAGTRVRSGKLEKHLKLGLLSSGLRAYTNNLIRNKDKPHIYLVPCNLNYHLVLEAETLIEDYLKKTGKGRFIIDDDESSKPRQVIRFVRELLNLDSQIWVTIGHPMDPFGNRVDQNGVSIDERGRAVDIKKYVSVKGEPCLSPQRDRVYTAEAGEKLAAAFKRNNLVLTTNLVAYATFELLRERNPEVDLYRLLRTAGDGTGIEMNRLAATVDTVTSNVKRLALEGKIKVDAKVQDSDPVAIIHDALRHFSSYHHHPVLYRRGDRMFTEDTKLLLYYRNRLDGYGPLTKPKGQTDG
jgi:glycerol-3-phosphate O-acyltransferase